MTIWGRSAHIADVHRDYADPPTAVVRNQGDRVLELELVMKPGFNGLTLGGELADEETKLKTELPLGMTLTQVSDQARGIGEAVGEFMTKFFTALAAVVVVSLLSLGFRVGLGASAVPLPLSVVFLIMMATGRDFDRITLGALIISLGLLVDDAIIAIEMMAVKMVEASVASRPPPTPGARLPDPR